METREKSFFFVYVASRGGIESRCSTPLNALSPHACPIRRSVAIDSFNLNDARRQPLGEI
jgi:hypothetical protein